MQQNFIKTKIINNSNFEKDKVYKLANPN